MRPLRPHKITWLVDVPGYGEVIIRATSEASARLIAARRYSLKVEAIGRVECLAP